MLAGLRKNPYLYILLGYLIAIVMGTIALSLPFATHNGIRIIDALYMATSAVCVTGLVVLDVSKDFTYAGQGILLFLIQIGGIGITVFSSFILLATMKSFSSLNQSIVEESLTVDREIKVNKLLLYVVVIILVFEAVGAALLTYFFSQEFPFWEALYKGVFISISAFCNAGFCIFSNSLENYSTHLGINLTVMLLIFVGGIGYFCIIELLRNFRSKGLSLKRYRFSIHSRVAFLMSIVLVLIGAILFFAFEYDKLFINYGLSDSVLISFFQSVSARTAGFNTFNFSIASPATLLIFAALMFIGASPSSCGGGIKTTTFSVLIKWFTASIKNRERVFLFNRSVPRQAVKRAVMLGILAVVWVFLAVIIISVFEEKKIFDEVFSFEDIIFEVVSALGTVGLSTGISDKVSVGTKAVITATMYFGRTGLLTLVSFFAFSIKEERFSYPEEDIFVG
jgi:trk system potassium uptake protein